MNVFTRISIRWGVGLFAFYGIPSSVRVDMQADQRWREDVQQHMQGLTDMQSKLAKEAADGEREQKLLAETERLFDKVRGMCHSACHRWCVVRNSCDREEGDKCNGMNWGT